MVLVPVSTAGADVWATFDTEDAIKEEIADPLNIDFKIGLDKTDLDRCAETLLLSQEQNAKSPLEPENTSLELVASVKNVNLSLVVSNPKKPTLALPL